jgi:hypothetical protein
MKKYNPDMQAKSYNLSKRLHIGVTHYITHCITSKISKEDVYIKI